MTEPIDTSTLGPIKIDHESRADMRTARSTWWTALTRRGDPMRIGNLALDAFEAGWELREGGDAEAVVERQRKEADDWFRRELDRSAKRPLF